MPLQTFKPEGSLDFSSIYSPRRGARGLSSPLLGGWRTASARPSAASRLSDQSLLRSALPPLSGGAINGLPIPPFANPLLGDWRTMSPRPAAPKASKTAKPAKPGKPSKDKPAKDRPTKDSPLPAPRRPYKPLANFFGY